MSNGQGSKFKGQKSNVKVKSQMVKRHFYINYNVKGSKGQMVKGKGHRQGSKGKVQRSKAKRQRSDANERSRVKGSKSDFFFNL
jgi:hypothetical protein